MSVRLRNLQTDLDRKEPSLLLLNAAQSLVIALVLFGLAAIVFLSIGKDFANDENRKSVCFWLFAGVVVLAAIARVLQWFIEVKEAAIAANNKEIEHLQEQLRQLKGTVRNLGSIAPVISVEQAKSWIKGS